MPARHALEDALDHLVAAIEAEEHQDEIGQWATAALAHRRGITFALSTSADPTAALQEVGEEWAGSVLELLDDQRDQQTATLRMAWAVVQRLVDGVRRRGLTASAASSPSLVQRVR